MAIYKASRCCCDELQKVKLQLVTQKRGFEERQWEKNERLLQRWMAQEFVDQPDLHNLSLDTVLEDAVEWKKLIIESLNLIQETLQELWPRPSPPYRREHSSRKSSNSYKKSRISFHSEARSGFPGIQFIRAKSDGDEIRSAEAWSDCTHQASQHESSRAVSRSHGSSASSQSAMMTTKDPIRVTQKMIERTILSVAQLSRLSRQVVGEGGMPPDLQSDPLTQVVYLRARDAVLSAFPKASPDIQVRLSVAASMDVARLVRDKRKSNNGAVADPPFNLARFDFDQNKRPRLTVDTNRSGGDSGDEQDLFSLKRTNTDPLKMSTDKLELQGVGGVVLNLPDDGILAEMAKETPLPVSWATAMFTDPGIRCSYVCVVPECETPFRMYHSVQDWEAHVSNHQQSPSWVCISRKHNQRCFFRKETDFQAHMWTEHPGLFEAVDLPYLVESCRLTPPSILDRCPLCAKSDIGHPSDHQQMRSRKKRPPGGAETVADPALSHILGHLTELSRTYRGWPTLYEGLLEPPLMPMEHLKTAPYANLRSSWYVTDNMWVEQNIEPAG